MSDYSYLLTIGNLDPERDDACQSLADYLAEGLNWAIAQKNSDLIAVKETRSYDAVDVDSTSFPLLKVFRQKETIFADSDATVSLVISYAMVMPDRAKLPGILHWVARHICAMLSAKHELSQYCNFRIGQEYQAEYRIMVNDFQQPAYAYLRIAVEADQSN